MNAASETAPVNSFAGLRIVLVGPLPPPAGGMAGQTEQLAALLREQSAQVELVQTNADYRPAWMGRIKGLRALCRLLPYLMHLWRSAGRADVMHVMANSGWSWHLFAAPAIWTARLRRLPVLVNYRGGEADAFLQRWRWLVAFTMRRAQLLLVPSGFLHAVFARHGMDAEVLPNVVDLQRFHPATTEDAAGQGPHLLVARNLEALYDNASAIRAVASLRTRFPAITLSVAGTGPERSRLEALAMELGVSECVHFLGRLGRDAMAELYRRCTLMLNPSLADNMPNSVLESMASGVPVVSTNVGGVPFLLEDGRTGLLVQPGDPQAMAAAAGRLLDDAGLFARMRCAGIEEVQAYTWGRIGPRLADFYRRLALPGERVR